MSKTESFFKVGVLQKFKYRAILPGKKGKGRVDTVEAYREEDVEARAQLKAGHKYKIHWSEIKIHMIECVGNINDPQK